MGKVLTLDQLVENFTSLFHERAYRLETLDSYDAPNEREPYARFLAGLPMKPGWRQSWKQLVGDVLGSGRSIARVHVVTEPLSDYMRFTLLYGYPANVEAGEDVRIIGRAQARVAGLPDTDYWLFDDNLALRLVYDDAGAVIRAEEERDPADLSQYQAWRATAMRLAMPLASYVTEHGIIDERKPR
jgi:hypothetical protein